MNPEINPQPEPTQDQENILAAADKPIPQPHRQADWKQPCKASHEESKKRRKIAKASRKINRRK